MFKFKKKSLRSGDYKYAGTPVLIIDPKPEEGKAAGFGLNREAVKLLKLELTGEEYLGFDVKDGRIGVVVGEKGEFSKAFRVGKTFTTTDDHARVVRGNHKPTWEYLSQSPLVTDNGAVLKFVKVQVEADVDADVFELVALTPEADNSPKAQKEAEEANKADAQPEVQETVPEFNPGF